MEQVINYLKELISKDDYIVVATSGGPDSMALLTILSTISRNVICAHVNHKVRTESEEEYLMVKNYCEKLGIVFEGTSILNYEHDNFHKYAREFRYNFFLELINKYNAKYLFTAHHGDDLIETILMRLTRGSTLKGYSGFKRETEYENIKIIRPFITLSKEDIKKYDLDNNIPFAIDKSNNSDKYTRNRYRKKVLPFLKEENHKVIDKFNDFSETLIEYDNYVEKQALKMKHKLCIDNKIDLIKFNKEDLVIKKRIIYLILDEIYNKNLDLITDKHVKSIINLISSSGPNSSINLPNGIIVTKSYDYLTLKKANVLSDYNFELTNKLILPNGKTIEKIKKTTCNSNYVCKLNSKEIKLPLYVRTKLDGDKMEVKNLKGSKKIKDIFIDEKINLSNRKEWPIVVDSNNIIVWLPGLKKSKFDKQKDEKYDIILKYY